MTLTELFRHYLKTQKASSATIKNYVADANNFLDWFNRKTGIKHQIAGQAIFSLFTRESIEEYKADLLKDTPFSTINRRLSALRKFGSFAQSRGWARNNPALKVKNVLSAKKIYPGGTPPIRQATSGVLKNFQKHLKQEKISQITIKNYLSDLRHFLAWLEVS